MTRAMLRAGAVTVVLVMLCHPALVAGLRRQPPTGPSEGQSCRDDAAAYYRSHWCGKPPPENLRFLDDRDCAKRFPTNCSREWRCPIVSSHMPTSAGWAPAGPLASLRVDTAVLSSVPELQRVRMAAVLVRRTASGGVFYRYFGGLNHTVPFETWSSSKIFAIANAAITVERQCPVRLGGLTATTHGRLGATPLGDLATIICSYDRTMNYTSNSLARYFHDLGGRRQADWLVQQWLGAGHGQSFGGNYGEPTPPDLNFTLTRRRQWPPAGGAPPEMCAVEPDHSGVVVPNSLSALSMVELLKRIVLHRELPPDLRLPGVAWEDLQQELYGAGGGAGSLFPTVQLGGMSADTAIFMQEAAEAALGGDAQAGDQWRVFSKLGAGFSTSRRVGEIVHNAYGCFPAAGVELLYSAQASVGEDVALHAAEAALHAGINAGVQAVLRAVERETSLKTDDGTPTTNRQQQAATQADTTRSTLSARVDAGDATMSRVRRDPAAWPFSPHSPWNFPLGTRNHTTRHNTTQFNMLMAFLCLPRQAKDRLFF